MTGELTVAGDPNHEEALSRLREAYASNPPGAFHYSFLKKVRDEFGFHYGDGSIRTKLGEFIGRGDLEGVVIAAESSGLSRYVIADHLSLGILQDVLAVQIHDLHAKFSDAKGKAIQLARDLSDIVDLMLLPLLEKEQQALLKIEEGTLPIIDEITRART